LAGFLLTAVSFNFAQSWGCLTLLAKWPDGCSATCSASRIGEEEDRSSSASPSLRDSPTVNPALPSETSHPTTLTWLKRRFAQINKEQLKTQLIHRTPRSVLCHTSTTVSIRKRPVAASASCGGIKGGTRFRRNLFVVDT